MNNLNEGMAEIEPATGHGSLDPNASESPEISDSATTPSAEEGTDTPVSAMANLKYGLERIIVVNSYVKNRARIVILNDDTHISGRNGRGKTSLLRLIPLFLGEQPSRMVKPSGEGMKPLRDYIFDSLSSYLVFEYRNFDGVKLAIMFYNNQGASCYMFCDGDYQPELFCENGQYVESRTLNVRLKALGRHPTPSMGVKDYQTVIQGRTDRARAGELRSYMRRFALAEKGNLAGIEKIASAMFFKDITFVALKRMAYSVMNETGDEVISTNMTDKSLDRFFANFRSYDEVMHHEQAFNDGRGYHHAYRDAVHQRREIAIKANLLSRHQAEILAELNRTIQKLADDLRASADTHAAKLRLIDQGIGKTTSAISETERLIAAVDAEQADFEQQNIESKRAQVSSIPQIQQRINDFNGHLTALQKESANINQKYDRQLNLLNEQSASRLKPLRDEQGTVQAQATQQQMALAEELKTQREQLDEELADAEAEVNAKVQQAQEALSALREERAELKPDPEFVQQLESHEAKRTGHAEEWDQFRQTSLEIAAEASRVKNQHGELDARIAETARQLQAKRAQYVHLQKLDTPGPDSLLHFLREKMPGWYENIGKVVRDDVLLNTALTPALVEELRAKNLYGVDIDLSKIESSLAAREQSLAEEIQNLRDAIDEDAHRLHTQEDELRKITETLTALGRKKDETDAMADLKKRTIDDLLQKIVALTRASEEELNARRCEFDLKVKVATGERDAILIRQREMPAIRRRRQNDLANTFSQRGKDINHFLTQELARIATNIADEERQQNDAKNNINASRDAELKNGGVDTATLKKVEDQILAETRALESARDAQTLVDRYERWRKTRPAEKENAAMALLAHRQKLGEQEAFRKTVIGEHEAYRIMANGRLENGTTRRNSLQDAQTKLDTFRGRQGTERHGYELPGAFEPLGMTLEFLAKEYGLCELKLKESRTRRNDLIYPIHSAFMSARDNTHVKAFSAKMPVSIIDSEDESGNIEAIIETLKSWYGTGHMQSRDSINIECQTACGQFDSYFSKLNGFRENVANLSRQLQNNLDSDMVFDAISNVSLRMSGRVERLSYWDELSSVIREYRRWRETECRGLPPRELYHQLKSMMTKITGGRLEESPENLIDMEIVVNDGCEKRVTNEAELKNVSSNGLSYMIMCMIFVSFVNRVRKDKHVWLTWALDEIGAIDSGNSQALLMMLDKHRINLVSAAPEGSANVLAIFKNHYEILEDFEIQRCLPSKRRAHHVD